MTLPNSKPICRGTNRRRKRLSAKAALAVAEDYLMMKVGDLLGPVDPRLDEDGRWVMSITLGNAIQGTLGIVGTIAADAATGEVLFGEEERARIEERAWELCHASTR